MVLADTSIKPSYMPHFTQKVFSWKISKTAREPHVHGTRLIKNDLKRGGCTFTPRESMKKLTGRLWSFTLDSLVRLRLGGLRQQRHHPSRVCRSFVR